MGLNLILLLPSFKPSNGSVHPLPGPYLSILCPSWAPDCRTCSVTEVWGFSLYFCPPVNFSTIWKTKSTSFSFWNCLSVTALRGGFLSPILLSCAPLHEYLHLCLLVCEYSDFYHSAGSSLRAVTTNDSQPLAQHQAWSQHLVLTRTSWPFNLFFGSLLWKYGGAEGWEEVLYLANTKELLNEERQIGDDGCMIQGFDGRIWLEKYHSIFCI